MDSLWTPLHCQGKPRGWDLTNPWTGEQEWVKAIQTVSSQEGLVAGTGEGHQWAGVLQSTDVEMHGPHVIADQVTVTWEETTTTSKFQPRPAETPSLSLTIPLLDFRAQKPVSRWTAPEPHFRDIDGHGYLNLSFTFNFPEKHSLPRQLLDLRLSLTWLGKLSGKTGACRAGGTTPTAETVASLPVCPPHQHP